MTRTLRLLLFAASAIGIAAMWFASAAQAQMACGTRASFIAQLDAKYGETRRSMGISGNSVVETFANEETGSWTILITSPKGIACILAAGQTFQLEPAKMIPTGIAA